MIQRDNNCSLIQIAVFKCHTVELLRYFQPHSEPQRHIKSYDPWSASLHVQMIGGVDAGRMWCTQSLSPYIYPSIDFIYPHPYANTFWNVYRWQNWETSLCYHQIPHSEWLSEQCMAHDALYPLKWTSVMCFRMAGPLLYLTHGAWLLTSGAWCRECILRASDVDL